jgi:hypothetical protein
VRFQVRLQPGQRIRPGVQVLPDASGEQVPSGLSIEAGGGTGLFHVTVAKQESQADFLLEYTLPKKQIRLPIRLAVPRLRWALRLQPADSLDWQSRPLSRSLAELLQSQAPALDVELPHHCQEELLLALKLVDPDTGADLPISDTQTLRRNQEHLRFDLKLFTDTLRGQLHVSFLEFRLEWLDPSLDQILSLPLLRLTQALDVQAARLQSRPEGGWMIHWHEPQPLHHRRLYLWSEWQPWVDPVDIEIPDDPLPSDGADAQGWWMLPIPDEYGLPPGCYRALFTVVPPYELFFPAEEPPSEALFLETLAPQERLRQIEVELQKRPQRGFALHLECVCVHESASMAAERKEEIQWCLAHWRDAPPLYLLYLHNWLERRDPNTQRAVRYMYTHTACRTCAPRPPASLAALPELPSHERRPSREAASLALELGRGPLSYTPWRVCSNPTKHCPRQ